MIRDFGDGKQLIWCDNCGDELDSGWLRDIWHYQGNARTGWSTVKDEHYCDKCAQDIVYKHEFRTCMVCKLPMDAGMTDLESFYCHEECFDKAMCDTFGEWRQVPDDGYDGYYEWYDAREDEWCGTGIFYTEWY